MRQPVTALLALSLLALPAACATPGTSASSPPPTVVATPDPQQSYWPGQEEVMAAAGLVEDRATARWPHAYAGVAVDLPGQAVKVHRIPTPGFDAEIRSLVPAMKLRFVDATHSAVTLNGWLKRIFNDRGWWQRRGVLVHGLAPQMGQHVDVEVGDPNRDAPRILDHYPDMDLIIKQGWPRVELTEG